MAKTKKNPKAKKEKSGVAVKAAKKALKSAKEQEKKKAESLKKMSKKAHDMARDTLKGDLRTVVVDLFKSRPEDFRKMGEAKQREVYAMVDEALDKAIEGAVQIIAAEGRAVCVGTLKKVTIQDGIKCDVAISKHDENTDLLYKAQGMEVLVVVASGKPFSGEKEAAKVDPDQPGLPFEGKKSKKQKSAAEATKEAWDKEDGHDDIEHHSDSEGDAGSDDTGEGSSPEAAEGAEEDA